MKKSFITKTGLIITGYAILLFVGGYMCGLNNNKIVHPIQKLFNTPTVSVLMSTYNRSEALPHAIESILNQTYDDFEFIIIDDGSNDDTFEQLRYYAQKDPRIVLLRNEENRGLIYSLNRGLDVARGKYIVRMDDDDKSVPYRLERQVWAMESNPDITILGGGILGKKSKPEKPLGMPRINKPDEVELNTYFSSGLAHPTIIIRRDFLEKNNIRYDSAYTYAEDCGLYKDVMAKGGRISSMKEGVLHFGYISGLKKPKKYSYIQSESFKKVQKEKLKPFFDAPAEMLGAFVGEEVRCEILKQMVPANKVKNILNQNVLEERMKKVCKPFEKLENTIEINHPYWHDSIAFEKDKKRFYRVEAPEETGQIIQEDDTTVTISWDNWDEEIYSKEAADKWAYLKDANGGSKRKK